MYFSVGHSGGRTQAHLKILEAIFLGSKYPREAEGEGKNSGTQVLGFQHVAQQLYEAGVLL